STFGTLLSSQGSDASQPQTYQPGTRATPLLYWILTSRSNPPGESPSSQSADYARTEIRRSEPFGEGMNVAGSATKFDVPLSNNIFTLPTCLQPGQIGLLSNRPPHFAQPRQGAEARCRS
ncbi:hypothetical protein, partial [Actinopolymorpha pittospori]